MSSTVETKRKGVITLENGQQAINMPANNRKAAIVDLKTLQVIATLMPRSDYRQSRTAFVNRIERAESPREYLAALADEYHFHMTMQQLDGLNNGDVEEEEVDPLAS